MAVPKLALRGVTKIFRHQYVLNGLTLEVPEGQALVVMGPSGCGKSVLLKHFIALLRPDIGEVLVDGVNLWSLGEQDRRHVRRRFGLAFQEGALFDSMSVFENVAFPLRRHTKLTRNEIRRRVEECLDWVRLPGVMERRPGELSTGMRRRVGFARAIALQPEILLFDEPTAALDPITVSAMDEVILELRRRMKVTTVMVTHDLRAARAVAERMALLFNGKLVEDAPAHEFELSSKPEVRQFLEGRLDGPLWQEGRQEHR